MQFIRSNKTIKLPDFLLVGAARSGTTSLYHLLKKNPKIFMTYPKELWFFCSNLPVDKAGIVIRDYNEYIRHFEKSKEDQILGEATTGYLYYHEETIKNIKRYHSGWKELKILIILRNPIERALSHYTYFRNKGLDERISFQDAISGWKEDKDDFLNYIKWGQYYKQVEHYLMNFSKVSIFLFEDLIENSEIIIEKIYNILGVPNLLKGINKINVNMGGVPKNHFYGYFVRFLQKQNIRLKETIKPIIPEMLRLKIKKHLLDNLTQKSVINSDCKNQLIDIYKDDVYKLGDLIGRDLSNWLK